LTALTRRRLIYQGKTKSVYWWDRFLLLFYFNDNILGFPDTGPDPGGNQVIGTSRQKGIFNLQLTSKIFSYLSECGLLNHYFLRTGQREALFWKTKKIPVEFVWRNFSAGRFYRENPFYGWLKPMEKKLFSYLKDDRKNDPPLAFDQIPVSHKIRQKIKSLMASLNHCLGRLLEPANLVLVDFKAEFGWLNNELVIIDELSTDTMRLMRKGERKILNWLEVKKTLE